MKYISPDEFLKLSESIPVIDVRSPGEYKQGHIPGARNIALFSDDERAVVGTLYKKNGRYESVIKGLELVGPKMVGFVEEAKELSIGGQLLVHCWRGGMRSESMAWLFEKAGISCRLLEGGYRSYRRYIRDNILKNKELLVLGGLTGSGKTKLLELIKKKGEPVVDLEHLARHRGSAFGGIGMGDQPTTEQFENELFRETSRISDDYLWVEDESLRIGKVFMPEDFYKKMISSALLFIEVPDNYRLDVLIEEYSRQDQGLLEKGILKIEQRLGKLAARQASESLKSGDYRETAEILLRYYDKTYIYGLSKRKAERVHRLNLKEEEPGNYPDRIIVEKKLLLSKKDKSAQ